MEKVNLSEKLSFIHDHWNPRIAGELNGQHVKLVKFQGEFVWHKHDHEDEMFFVVMGVRCAAGGQAGGVDGGGRARGRRVVAHEQHEGRDRAQCPGDDASHARFSSGQDQ